ncbi:MAG: insulinase family protein [Calditrichaeota bacterium]|nr:insulinase family protein [Calditrichota bacterium]
MNRKLVILLCLVLIPASFLNAQNKNHSKINTLPDGVSIHLLDNGMQVLLIENPALPMIGANVVVKVGSAYETFATSGMSHMLEHLLFNGTTTRKQKELYDDADRIGGYNNANTSDYYTNYMMVTPSEHIIKGMEIQADMLFNSILPDEKFEKEKGIVLEEISKSLAEAREQLERNTNAILYPGHALSLPTLGTYATIEGMSRDEVNDFYKNNYVPNNMILSVVGNFKSSEMINSVKEIYGKAKPGLVTRDANPAWKTGFEDLLANTNQKDLYFRFFDGSNVQFQMLYPIPSVAFADYYELMGVALENNKSKIEDAVKGKFQDQFKSVDFSTHNSPIANWLEITVSLTDDVDFNALTKIVQNNLAKFDFAISKDEIDMQVAGARTSFLKNIEKPHMFGIYNARPFSVGGIEAVLASYSGSKLKEGAELLKGLKIDSKPITIIQNPAPKDEQGSSESITRKLFKDEKSGLSLITVQNKASNLLAIHYLYKHKAFFDSKYGKDAAKILHDCFGQRLKSDENQKISAKFGLSYKVNDNPWFPMDNIYLHPDFGYIRAEALADDIPGVINFLNSQMNGFKPTEKEFQKAVGKFSRSNPMMGGGNKAKKMFENIYKSAIYEDNPFEKNTNKIDFENIQKYAEEYFQSGNIIISVVSPESPENIEKLFAGLKGSISENEPIVFSTKLKKIDQPVTSEEKMDGQRSYLFWGFTKEIDPADKAAMTALSLVLSDKIVFDIREKQGMAYRIKAGIEIKGDKALFNINQGTRPQNVDVLLPQYPGFFEMEKLDGLTENDVQKSINMYLGRMMFRRLSSVNQAYYLATSLYFNNDMNYDATFLDQLKNTKLKDVMAVAKKYMKVENPVQVIVR